MDLASIFLDTGHGKAQLLVPWDIPAAGCLGWLWLSSPGQEATGKELLQRVHMPAQGSWNLWL